jgi:DNA-binding IclR family transcriptional regulator
MIANEKTDVPALDRALDILELLSKTGLISHKSIIDQLSLPQASGARIIKRLNARGYIEKNNSGLYGLGPAINAFENNQSIVAHMCNMGEPLLKQLQKKFSHSVMMLHWTNTAWECIFKVEHEDSLSLQQVGETRVDIFDYPWGIFAYEQLKKENRKLVLKYDGESLLKRLVKYENEGYVSIKNTVFSRFTVPVKNLNNDLVGAIILSFDNPGVRATGKKNIVEELLKCSAKLQKSFEIVT